MQRKRILYIAYFYPPIGGLGIPAIQRVKRFIRYISSGESHVLTLKPNCYPKYIVSKGYPQYPFNDEIVHRAGVINTFYYMVNFKKMIQKVFNKKKQIKSNDVVNNETKSFSVKERQKFMHLKNIVSIGLNYPDFARPWILTGVSRGIRIVKRSKIDIIIATGMPWSSLIVGMLIKMATGIKLIADFRDPWVNNPFIEKGKLENRLDDRIEALVVAKADLVIANTLNLKNEMCIRYPDYKKKIVVLHNGYDPDDFMNLPKINYPESTFIITHAGFLYLKRDPIDILKAFIHLKTYYPEIFQITEFRQIGSLSLNYDIKEYCRKNEIHENVIFFNQMNHSTCLAHLAASDILIIIQPGTKTQIPSKLYEYIYFEKPIVAITEKDGALANMIVKHKFGRFFEPDDHQGIAEYIAELAYKKIRKDCLMTDYSNKGIFNAEKIMSDFQNKLDKL